MKRFIPVALLFVVCVFMLLSCGLSATQIENNLKQEGYVTQKWTDDEISTKFATIYDSEDFEITSVLEGRTGSRTILVVQLTSSAQAKAFKDALDEIIVNDMIEITIEGRLALVGQKEDISIALGMSSTNDK